jgi:hypothetical protein
MMEWAGLSDLAARLFIQRKNGSSVSDKFITITAIFPSGFKNAVVNKLSVVEELMIRFAPGRINLEKWPM